jgi:hypothetical protein
LKAQAQQLAVLLLLWRRRSAAVLQGLAFLFTAKGGLGLSFEHGWGCVVQRLGKRAADMEAGGANTAGCLDGCVWSAPTFVRINNVGVGLTVGERTQRLRRLSTYTRSLCTHTRMKKGNIPAAHCMAHAC